MIDTKIEQGFILAAGHGTRMRPLTDDIPKPMVPVHGKPIIGYAIDAFAAHGIKHCVINTHYKPDTLHAYLKTRNELDITIVHEPDLLDTGGGLQNGMRYLDTSKPVLAAAGDSIWQDAQGLTTLNAMQSAWNDKTMDMLLLLQPLETMVLTHGVGDYTLNNNHAIRSADRSGTHMWTSLRIFHPRIFTPARDMPFSFLHTMDACEAEGRLHGLSHQGIWHHLSTPDDVRTLNAQWLP